MTSPRDCFSFLTLTVMVMSHQSQAGCKLPPPTGLSYEWLDPSTVNLSWNESSGLPEVGVKYGVIPKNGRKLDVIEIPERYSVKECYTEDSITNWTYIIWTTNQTCKSENKTITIRPQKPKVEVKDFKCLLYSKTINCSWIKGNQSVKLRYRKCGVDVKQRNTTRDCDQPYSGVTRSGCHLNADIIANNQDICMFLENESGRSTFQKIKLMVEPPKLSVREEGDNLILSFVPPNVSLKPPDWPYYVCYTRCNEPQTCLEYSSNSEPKRIPYDKRCLYTLRCKIPPSNYVSHGISSDFGNVVTYGIDEPEGKILTIVAIVIPITLSVFMLLSCYCLRRHSAIIFPIVPDPSAIFKEMMNGNKEVKSPPAGNLYTPVPELVEHCNVTLVPENSVLLQNS